jgi:hypothetical protein
MRYVVRTMIIYCRDSARGGQYVTSTRLRVCAFFGEDLDSVYWQILSKISFINNHHQCDDCQNDSEPRCNLIFLTDKDVKSSGILVVTDPSEPEQQERFFTLRGIRCKSKHTWLKAKPSWSIFETAVADRYI